MENHYPEILRQYLGQERVGSVGHFDVPTRQAADICGRCQSASEAAKGSEPVSREERSAFGEKVEPYLKQHGFDRFKNDDYYNSSISVKLEDLHDENVFLDDAGNLLFIDPVIYFETPDLKLGGQHVFRFPFD